MRKYRNNSNKKNKGVLSKIETIILTILVISFIILIYCIYISASSGKTYADENYNTTKLSSQTNIINNTLDNSAYTIDNISNAIVGISTIKNKGNTIFLSDGTKSLNLGTGFIVSDSGYIVTNEHVSGEKTSTCYVTLIDGKMYTGNVIWSDSDVDLSIVKINATNLSYVNLGDSDNIKITDKVYAIGNPVGFEFQRTVTSGIISGLDRTVKITENENTTYMEDLIQTDATINPGNSGGPLINTSGEVIGINSVKITNAEGIGFAYPINVIKPVIQSLQTGNEYISATLGVFAYDKNVIPYINQELGINQTLNNGIYVASVIKNSPAENVGIKEGDILLNIDDIELNKMSDLRKYIYSKKPGDSVKIKYLRNKKEAEVTAILSKK